MSKINWRQKLSSRKFWAAISGVIISLLVIFKIDNPTIEQITALIAAIGSLVSYILAEGYVDGKRQGRGDNTL